MGKRKENKSEQTQSITEKSELTEMDANNDPSNLTALVKNLILKEDFLEQILDRVIEKVVFKLKDSIDFNTKIIDDLRSELSKRDEIINNLQEQLKRIHSNFEEEVEEISQYSRRNNIEIHGIPELPQENVYNLVSDIGKALECNINKKDIDVAHRVPSSNKSLPRPIIVKFINRWQKGEIMIAKRNKKLLTSSIGIPSPEKPIFINDHLTPRTKGILRKAKDLRNKGFKYVWSRDGKIFVRKDEASQAIVIKSLDDVVKLETL